MYDEFAWTRASLARNKLTRIYEPIQPFMLIALARHFSSVTFFDVGANIGVYSVFMAAQEQVTRVFAFEPMSELAHEVRSNAALNGHAGRIEVVPKALSLEPGEATFNKLDDFSGAGGIAATYPFDENIVKSRVQVPLTTLDSYLDAVDGDICLKIDVEGHESEVLAGGSELLQSKAGLLQVEIHETSGNRAQTFGLLDSLGWRQVLRIGWDYYFSNSPTLTEEPGRTRAIEDGLQLVVDDSLAATRPARLSLGRGITLEIPRSKANRLKRVLRGGNNQGSRAFIKSTSYSKGNR